MINNNANFAFPLASLSLSYFKVTNIRPKITELLLEMIHIMHFPLAQMKVVSVKCD